MVKYNIINLRTRSQMGLISQDAQKNFFDTNKKNAELIKFFLNGFDISAAYEKHVSNTTIYAYILKPEDHMKETFGFDKELLLVYSPYERMEPRTIQAIDEIYRLYPFYGRVDMLNCFLLSDADNIEEWIQNFAKSETVRIIIPFAVNEIKQNKNDTWYLRNKLRKYFFGLDLFGYTLPLSDDLYFFGRQQIIARYIDAIKRSENGGIFGLRKTGKTSLLYKIKRLVNEQQLGKVFIYDCKSPQLRKLHVNEFLFKIYADICSSLNLEIDYRQDEINVVNNLHSVVNNAAENNIKLILIFDEIEYISFIAPLDEHWKIEYVDFWQTIWSIQSTLRNLVFIVAGVNASVTEIDSVSVNNKKIQNPMFSIVQSVYLTGLSAEECGSMIRTLGKRIGLKFDYTAVNYIYEQYGGHPLLTRLACSKLNMLLNECKRPIEIDAETIKRNIITINSELVYYFKHIISELQEFYPDEYEMFELLASGQIADFLELSSSIELTRHLYDYGLITNDKNNLPVVSIPVAGDFVAMELAKKENRKTMYKLVRNEYRYDWVKLRIKSIIQDMRQLEAAIHQHSLPSLFGKHSFPEADKLIGIQVVENDVDFVSFINTMNRCFVESIENYGKEIGDTQYFNKIIATSYPSLYPILYRIKVYRHSQDHVKLNNKYQNDFNSFYREDTEGFITANDRWFVIQQRLLDGMFANIQLEINKLV